jgi:O-antigen/teichoic acid export membrane protein
VFDQGLVSLGVGALVRSCVVFLVTASYTFSVWVRKSYPPLQLDRKYTFEILKKSLPLIGTNLMGLVSNNSKELALAVLVNPAAVAVLSITGRLFSLVSTIVNPISLSVFTGLASISVDESKFKKWAKDLLSFYNLFSGLMYAIALTVNAVFISAWVGIDKYGGLILSILLCLSQWLISKANMYITILNAKGIFSKTAQILAFDLMARLTFFGFIFLLNIPFKMITFPLIEVLGMMFTVSFLHYISCVRIFEKNQRLIQSLFGYLPKMIYYICLSLVLYYLTNKIRIDDVNKWVHAIMVTSIVLAAFAFVSLIKRSDYVVIKNVSSNIR